LVAKHEQQRSDDGKGDERQQGNADETEPLGVTQLGANHGCPNLYQLGSAFAAVVALVPTKSLLAGFVAYRTMFVLWSYTCVVLVAGVVAQPASSAATMTKKMARMMVS
jgi:hypothetical protein